MKKEIHIWSMLIAILSPIVGIIAGHLGGGFELMKYIVVTFCISFAIALITADKKHFRSGGKIGPPGYPF